MLFVYFAWYDPSWLFSYLIDTKKGGLNLNVVFRLNTTAAWFTIAIAAPIRIAILLRSSTKSFISSGACPAAVASYDYFRHLKEG